MIKIFYRRGSEIIFTQSETDFAAISKENALWIDLLEPTGEEKRAAEAFIGTEIQSRAQAEEIESSSRFSENDVAMFANTNFMSPEGDEMSMDPVSFVLSGSILTTLRETRLRSFDSLQTKMLARPGLFLNGFMVFVAIMDRRVDLDADIIELLAKNASQFSKRINQEEDINEEFLLDINQLQENAMVVRENMVDKQRLITNILKSDSCPDYLDKRLGVILQDISSLINHVNFTFERLEYLQDTVLGIINLDQNKIMKIFTFISLLLMPATLIASFYGMNVSLPFAGCRWAWIAILVLMALLICVFWILFKRKRML